MIRATELSGRAVVDVEAAEKIGRIDKIILDPEARRVAAFVVSNGSSFLHEGTRVTVPASAVKTIGPDAVTVRHAELARGDDQTLEGLPTVSDMVGRRVVTVDGRLLGAVDDVLVDGGDGRIVGYTLTNPDVTKFQTLVSGDRRRQPMPYLRADADLKTGRDLIVAPEGAVCSEGEDDTR
jgi:uncharacterized protein YrrD